MRILGIDLGKKRMGIAISNESSTIAFPHSIIDIKNAKNLLQEIKKIKEELNANLIVLSYPLNMNGTRGEAALQSERIAEDIRNLMNIEVVLWDERLTTVQAEKSLLSGDLSRNKRQKLRDKIAAAILLQSYLDSILI